MRGGWMCQCGIVNVCIYVREREVREKEWKGIEKVQDETGERGWELTRRDGLWNKSMMQEKRRRGVKEKKGKGLRRDHSKKVKEQKISLSINQIHSHNLSHTERTHTQTSSISN
jgi:hypothetical protein